MIVYSLHCANGHTFDEWFASSADFEERAGQGGIACPECGDTAVRKAIMAPNIGGAKAAEPAAPACVSCAESGACPWAG